jgi:hypothetical protein
MAASADAALARKQYADAERLIADGKKAYPSHAGWADLSRRLAEARRAAPALKGNAPMPAKATAATPPPAAAAPAPATAAPPGAPQLAQLIAVARDAIKRSDFATAEKAVADAEKLDAKAASVVEVRAELKVAQDKSKASPAPPPPAPPAPAAAPAQPPASRN